MGLVRVTSLTALHQPLQFKLHIRQHVGIKKLPQLLCAQQVAQQLAVERQRRGTTFRQRRIAFVHVHGDPREKQRLRERRRAVGVRRHHANAAAAQTRHHLRQARQIEHVVGALPSGLQQDRE